MDEERHRSVHLLPARHEVLGQAVEGRRFLSEKNFDVVIFQLLSGLGKVLHQESCMPMNMAKAPVAAVPSSLPVWKDYRIVGTIAMLLMLAALWCLP